MRIMYQLWLRQFKRFLRSKSRIVGTVGQPVLFLLALGYGLGSVYKQAGQGNFLQFLVPGIMAQTVLFAAMFFGATVMFDKQFGFLKETLVAPVSRSKIMFGGALGGATTTTIQAVILLVVATALGFRPTHWLMIVPALVILLVFAVAIACFSSGIGSMVEDMQGFQAINQFLVLPLYFMSGAIYPLTHAPTWLRVIGDVNPVSYTVDAVRDCLIGQTHFGLIKDLLVLLGTVVILAGFGVLRFNRIEA